jgi:tetratricopeptide (TPR) repeat protein
MKSLGGFGAGIRILACGAILVAGATLSATASAKQPLLKSVPTAPAAAAKVSDQEVRKLHLEALELAAKGKNKSALKILEKALRLPTSPDEKDRVQLTLGRVLYESGDLTKAQEAYRKIDQRSSSWLEALEERAWVELRMGQPEQAMATVKTLITPIFTDRVRSEPYFLLALAQLRVCAYSAVFKTLEKFKSRYRERVRELESSSDPSAKERLQEIAATIQKLNLVEAEAIQRLYIDENGKKHTGDVPRIARGSHDLAFPEAEGEEIWMDEIESWKVRVKGCPAPKAGNSRADSGVSRKGNT